MFRSLALVLLFSFSQLSIAQNVDDEKLLEIGVGAAATSHKDLEAVFEIEFNGNAQVSSEPLIEIVVANLAADIDFSVTEKKLEKLDIVFRSLGVRTKSQSDRLKSEIAFTLMNINARRDIEVGNGQMVRVSLLGVSGGTELVINEKIKTYLKASLDFLSLHTSNKRLSDSSSVTEGNLDSGLGLGVEVGAVIGRFQIATGIKYDDMGVNHIADFRCFVNNPDGSEIEITSQNMELYDEYYCSDVGPRFSQYRKVTKSYLKILASITKNLSAFGEASYTVYSVEDSTNEIVDSRTTAFLAKVGLLYNF